MKCYPKQSILVGGLVYKNYGGRKNFNLVAIACWAIWNARNAIIMETLYLPKT